MEIVFPVRNSPQQPGMVDGVATDTATFASSAVGWGPGKPVGAAGESRVSYHPPVLPRPEQIRSGPLSSSGVEK